ncbi:hypothetical protein LTR95_010081 [Oleoguttula sp. CCFEE 5521]
MAIKRRRSSPVLLSPSPDTSTASSGSSPIASFYTHSKPVAALYAKPTWSWPTYSDEPRHLPSRTRKRHRDDRPDEEDVYSMCNGLEEII